MSPRRHSNAARKLPPQPEFGDWRLPLQNPAEAEHLPIPKLTRLQRLHLHVEYLEACPVADLSDWQELRGWPCWWRRLTALFLLLPLSSVVAYSLLVQLAHAAPAMEESSFWLSVPVWYSLLGLLLFMVLKITHLADPVLLYAYVAGHELTHAVAAKLSFGKVQSVNIDLSGGYVETDADNLFIALSPYFVPLWMVLWMFVFWVANALYPFAEYQAWFCAGFGFWWAFHLYWTAWIMRREQPDLLENGVEFSFLIILLLNFALLLLVLWGFGFTTPAGFARDFCDCAGEFGATFRDVYLGLRALYLHYSPNGL